MCTEIIIHDYCKMVDENFVIKYKYVHGIMKVDTSIIHA